MWQHLSPSFFCSACVFGTHQGNREHCIDRAPGIIGPCARVLLRRICNVVWLCVASVCVCVVRIVMLCRSLIVGCLQQWKYCSRCRFGCGDSIAVPHARYVHMTYIIWSKAYNFLDNAHVTSPSPSPLLLSINNQRLWFHANHTIICDFNYAGIDGNKNYVTMMTLMTAQKMENLWTDACSLSALSFWCPLSSFLRICNLSFLAS